MDPFDPKKVGMSYPKLEADIVTVSHQHADHNNLSAINGAPVIIDWPGEFEVQGVRIFGYPSFHDKKNGAERGEVILYKFEIEDITVLHCGDIGLVPDASEIESVGKIDVLLIPTGGVYTINPAEAAKLVQKIEPSLVIPMHYNHDRLNQETFGELAPVDEFIKEVAGEVEHAETKITLKKDDLKDETKVIVMKG